MQRGVAIACLIVGLLAAPATAVSQPPPIGIATEVFRARDLLGHERDSRELIGRPTLVAVLTHRHAGAMLPMLDRALERYPGQRVHLVLVLALDLPFYATTEMARAAAREQIDPERWGDTWLDRSGTVQRVFRLPHGTREPFVFVLDADGRVTATVRGIPTEDDIERVWRALPPP